MVNQTILNQYKDWLEKEKAKEQPIIAKSLLQSKGVPNLNFIGKRWLDEFNINSGKMLQIGGSIYQKESSVFIAHELQHPWYNKLEYFNFDLIDDKMTNTIVGDITNAPMLKNNEYDFVFSSDTFEHISEPWKAAKEIVRILKPGGICFIYSCFSWRYHEVPVDYWRFTPSGFAYLFQDLICLEANFDSKNRRGPIQGDPNSGANDMVPEDDLGAWRENWRCYYAGRKK